MNKLDCLRLAEDLWEFEEADKMNNDDSMSLVYSYEFIVVDDVSLDGFVDIKYY